jgi:hypothetical protein
MISLSFRILLTSLKIAPFSTNTILSSGRKKLLYIYIYIRSIIEKKKKVAHTDLISF